MTFVIGHIVLFLTCFWSRSLIKLESLVLACGFPPAQVPRGAGSDLQQGGR